MSDAQCLGICRRRKQPLPSSSGGFKVAPHLNSGNGSGAGIDDDTYYYYQPWLDDEI